MCVYIYIYIYICIYTYKLYYIIVHGYSIVYYITLGHVIITMLLQASSPSRGASGPPPAPASRSTGPRRGLRPSRVMIITMLILIIIMIIIMIMFTIIIIIIIIISSRSSINIIIVIIVIIIVGVRCGGPGARVSEVRVPPSLSRRGSSREASPMRILELQLLLNR